MIYIAGSLYIDPTLGKIEKLCDKYPELEKVLITKIEALRVGISFTDLALKTAKDKGDVVLKGLFDFQHERSTKGEELAPPYQFILEDGPLVQTRIFEESPYTIDLIDGKYWFCEGSEQIAQVTFPPKPIVWDNVLADGTPYESVAFPLGDNIGSSVLNVCEYWKIGGACLFCDMNTHLQAQLKLGKKMIVKKKPEHVAQVFADVLRYQPFRHCGITGGTVVTKIDGLDEVDFYCQYLDAIREKIDGKAWFPSYVAIGPQEKEGIKKLFDTGFTCYAMHLEVWDPELFKILCPGKAKLIGRDEWLRRMISGVKIFGEGRIATNFVSGIEMAKPWGFREDDIAVKSTLEGIEWCITHGVAPRTDMWAVEPGSVLGGQEPPPADYFCKLHIGEFELFRKYGLLQPGGWCAHCHLVGIDYDHAFYPSKYGLTPVHNLYRS